MDKKFYGKLIIVSVPDFGSGPFPYSPAGRPEDKGSRKRRSRVNHPFSSFRPDKNTIYIYQLRIDKEVKYV